MKCNISYSPSLYNKQTQVQQSSRDIVPELFLDVQLQLQLQLQVQPQVPCNYGQANFQAILAKQASIQLTRSPPSTDPIIGPFFWASPLYISSK